jgi:hypothetical protein
MMPWDMAQMSHSLQFSSARSVGRSPKMTRPRRPVVSRELSARLLPIESSSFSFVFARVADTIARLFSSPAASSSSSTLSVSVV